MSPTMLENEVEGVVVVDGLSVPGFLVPETACASCGSQLVHHDTFDARFCPGCNVWLESRCADPTCSFCSARPELPLGRS